MKALEYLYRMLKANQEIGNTPENILECITELEALQQSKSCEGCKYGVFENEIKYVSVMDEQLECCLVCIRNCNDYFEPKEQ